MKSLLLFINVQYIVQYTDTKHDGDSNFDYLIHQVTYMVELGNVTQQKLPNKLIKYMHCSIYWECNRIMLLSGRVL